MSHEYNGFDGIDRTPHSGGLTDIVNFRLMADKTLKLREAAVRLTSLKDRPRAHYVCDSENLLILSGSRVYYLNLSDLSQKEIGTVLASEGDAQFICYNGKILLLDGDSFYVCGENGLYPVNGYAPLYGKGWHPVFKGRIHQNLNLLSRHYRLSYDINENNPTIFNLDVRSDRINAAYVNGIRANESKLTISDDGLSVSCELLLAAGSELTLYITAASYPPYRDEFKSCTAAETFGEIDNRGADVSSIVFCRGSNPSTVFSTRRIEKSDFDDAKLEYPNMMPIYVTRSDMMTVGNGKSPVTAMCKRGGKLLVFTPDNAYVMTEAGDSSSLVHLSSAGGCSISGAATAMGEYPITVSESGILKWSPVRYDSNEYVASCISLPIAGLPQPSFYTSAVVYNFKRKNEIWFTDPSSDDKRVFIYNSLLDIWYSFNGISADSFFDTGSLRGFFCENDIYVFDETSFFDNSGITPTPIIGKIVTGRINFGSFDCKKRLYKLALRTMQNCSLISEITDASGKSIRMLSSDTAGEQSGYIEQRVPAARSRYYTIAITNIPGKNSAISGMSLSATR